MIGLLSGSLVAALAGSPHCVGMCGGFALACADDPKRTAAWHAGRLGTYAALGALAGAAGRTVPGPEWLHTAIAAAMLVWFTAGIAGLVRPLHVPIPGLSKAAAKLARDPSLLARVGFGALTGLLPCGLVYGALSVPVALARPDLGALAMLVFGLGTLPALIAAAAGLRKVIDRGPWTRRIVAAVVLIAGLWALSWRGVPGEPSCH